MALSAKLAGNLLVKRSEGKTMKYIVIILLGFCLVGGCTSALPIARSIDANEEVVTKDEKTEKEHPEEEHPEEEHEDGYTLYLKSGQEALPDEQKIIVIRQVEIKETEITLETMYQTLIVLRQKLAQALYWYNFAVDKIVEIHEHPDFNIVAPEIPEKANIRWFIPIKWGKPFGTLPLEEYNKEINLK